MAIAVPTLMNVRTPRSKSSCRTIAAIGPPMPNAVAVTRLPLRVPVTVRSPRCSGRMRALSRRSAIRSIRARSPVSSATSPTSSFEQPMYQALGDMRSLFPYRPARLMSRARADATPFSTAGRASPRRQAARKPPRNVSPAPVVSSADTADVGTKLSSRREGLRHPRRRVSRAEGSRDRSSRDPRRRRGRRPLRPGSTRQRPPFRQVSPRDRAAWRGRPP